MSLDIDGRIALVTGAAGGIGRAIALRLAAERATVIATDLDEIGGFSLVEAIEAGGGTAAFYRHDVTKEDNWEAVIRSIKERYGRLDILVNNAGVGFSGPVEEMALERWRFLMAVNVDGPFLGVKHGLPLMRAGGSGSIINISSIAAMKASANASAYCASKAAVRYFTKSVALECAAARDGVRVNSLHPGIVETAIWDSLIGTDVNPNSNRPRTETLKQFTGKAVPLGRPGTVEEVAAAVFWLASDESSYVTGAELVVDGARSIA